MTTTTSEPHDPRIERILDAAEQHGQNDDPDHEVGDLQDVLRAAWSLMSSEQRNQLMAAAETVNVLQAGEDFVEVAQLRAYLLDESGIHRVRIEVTRDGSGGDPEVSALKVFDASGEELRAGNSDIDTGNLKRLGRRLDRELLKAMPPQAVEPAWVSTIDWDVGRDVLTHSVRIEGIDRNIQPLRWRNASDALDRHLLPELGDGWREERVVVMELQPALGRAMPRWAELTLNSTAIGQLREGRGLPLGTPSLPVRAGGAADGKDPSVHFNEPKLVVRDFGETVQLCGANEDFWPMTSARVPLRLFLQWVDARPARETLFVSESGELLNHDDDFARHSLWVDEYHRCIAPGLLEPETEFDGERPRG
ncbi:MULTISPECIES: hypothetical protein [unclassified Variovorax]|uniref:hypothetical protein n=1 Tax=unclassified Variovorax TaxID=663243 RepID=UPI00076C7A36|nr:MULTISPECIES: hypothetical protein [unclassified Variovorax]KWT69534.1 hypothetical protein APY03_6894 [Variovorax sp. WDL1]PNG48852.1 hypothetical protein CHC06_06620 [Variovorax sp. B2]PNG49359.1 hypothetical protein CHC07_06268 [Variovorax sp. B4]VTV18347.1 hypothetical protein WDL1P2_00056 [Variovorax sp. WDL1]